MGVRARSRSAPAWLYEVHASDQSTASTAGKRAAHGWLQSQGLSAPALTPWHVEVSFDVRDTAATLLFDERRDTRFRIEIYSEEWGFFFCHRGKASWIRTTDISFVHGRDDFGLLPSTPPLKDIGALLGSIQRQHALTFRREHALVRTNLQSAELAIRLWILSL